MRAKLSTFEQHSTV
ncbi:hypothetical protein ABFA07_006015 [Porites harrisoni]